MNKRFLIIALMVLIVGSAAALLVNKYTESTRFQEFQVVRSMTEKERADAATKLLGNTAPASAAPIPLPLSQPVRLAIGGLGFADDEQNGRFADLMLAELQSAAGFEFVDRQSLDAILRETHLSLSGLVRAKDAVRVGKLLRADWFVLGTIAKVHETNSMVVRVVDARTGIMEDAAVVAADSATPALAKELADFVRQSRKAAAEAKPRTYLAVGAFEDLSLNNRQAEFPAQLHGYLTAAYQGSGVTLLERENVDILLQEMRLDIAGLTEAGSRGAPPPALQSAFWLVDGSYQSYETGKLEVEVSFQMRRIFGTTKRMTLRGPPGEPVCAQIKKAVDAVMSPNSGIVIPSRLSEARAQMAIGKDLAGLDSRLNPLGIGLTYTGGIGGLPPREANRQRRNVQEAIRAFETVLLLDPGNHPARLYLAACLRHPTISRMDEARNLYREVIEDPMQDEWTEKAKQALVFSFVYGWGEGNQEKALWFEKAEKQNTNSAMAQFYKEQAELANEAAMNGGNLSAKAKERAEIELFKRIHGYDDVMHRKSGSSTGGFGFEEYARIYGTNTNAALWRLDELFPRMTKETPEIVLHLSAGLVEFQSDTNTVVIKEFQRQLSRISVNATNMLNPDDFWNRNQSIYNWAMKHEMYEMAAQFMQKRIGAAASGVNFWRRDNNEDKVALAYAELAMNQWKPALDIFESLSNCVVLMEDEGAWSARRMTVVMPRKVTAKIRQEHGLPEVRDPREFELSRAFFAFPMPGGTFAADETGVWIGINGKLFQLGFDLKTNCSIGLPISPGAPVNAVCLTPKTVWIGTGEEGLLEVDRASHACRVWKEKDGLMMNTISSLYATGDTLWIGYGVRTYVYYASGMSYGGGLGKLDLGTRQFASFTLSLTNGLQVHRHLGGNAVPESPRGPTRRPVLAIAAGDPGDVWFVTEDTSPLLRRFQVLNNAWGGPPEVMWHCTSLAKDGGRLLVGIYSGQNDKAGPLGVNILNTKDGKWRGVKEVSEVPSGVVTTLALNGHDLWVGGKGYIAVMDLNNETIRKYAFINADAVDGLQIAGGWIWAKYGGYLHRASLSDAH
ncbi:MAG: hypothetical protein JWQ04_1516 [Pedosphaera sp.]|nr:hypothetical protein [Pedosphaera sp.]